MLEANEISFSYDPIAEQPLIENLLPFDRKGRTNCHHW